MAKNIKLKKGQIWEFKSFPDHEYTKFIITNVTKDYVHWKYFDSTEKLNSLNNKNGIFIFKNWIRTIKYLNLYFEE